LERGNEMKKRILIILGIMMMFIVSCGGKHPAVKDFEETMKNLQSGDVSKLSEGPDKIFESNINPEMKTALTEGLKKITYKINKTTENKDKNEVIINVTMKSPDLSGVMKELFEKVAGLMAQMKGKTEKEIGEAAGKVATELIKERIKSGKTKEKTFDVVYTKKDDKWSPDVASNKDYFEMLTMNMASME